MTTGGSPTPLTRCTRCFIEVADLVKKYFKDQNIKANTGQEVPVVAVGKLGYPDIAERALKRSQCDMIMLGRPLLADPHWPNKVYAGGSRI